MHAQHLPGKRHKPIGLHSVAPVRFRFDFNDELVDLEFYTVRVWVQRPDLAEFGPFTATKIDDVTAEYLLSEDDTSVPSPSLYSGFLTLTAVAESSIAGHILVSKAEIPISSWAGSETYTPL